MKSANSTQWAKSFITYETNLEKHDALELELKNFLRSIIGKEKPIVMENLVEMPCHGIKDQKIKMDFLILIFSF